MKQKTIEKLVPDTSVIAEGLLSKRIESKEILVKEIIIHEAVLSELENQANNNRETGYIGLNEINKLRELSKKYDFVVSYVGNRPREFEINYAKSGAIDNMIRSYAYENSCVLMTADKVQALVAESKGIDVILVEFDKKKHQKIKLETFFDETTMSVHIRENLLVYAKKGVPGNWVFESVSKDKLKREDVISIADEIIEEVSINPEGFIEIERVGSTIVQLGRYRIVIAKPPFADAWEITAVRPVKTLELKDYALSEKLMQRIKNQAEGVLVAGSPGMGKSTFVSALAEFYASMQKVVKTVEAPRDLVVSDSVTQYAISRGSAAEVHDILLLSRPDYTIFDEMRNTSDFSLFADMRLAGVGMIGIVHATNPIDAIQRFIGRVEMGVIPQIIDTVVFIKNGGVNAVLSLKMTVAVPSGMTEADLARPLVLVSDFESGKPVFEIYTYGEQTVVMPVVENFEKKGILKLAEEEIKRFFQKYASYSEVDVISNDKCIVYVPDSDIAGIIGKQGKNIEKIENMLGMHVDVRSISKDKSKDKKESESNGFGKMKVSDEDALSFDYAFSGKSVSIFLDQKHKNMDVNIYVNGDYLLTAKSSKKGVIKIKRSKLSNILFNALKKKEDVFVSFD